MHCHPFLLKKNNRIKRKNPFEEVWFVKQTDVAVSVVLLLFLRQENILCFQFGKQCCPARKQKNLGDRLKQNVGFCLFSFAFSTQISRRSRQKYKVFLKRELTMTDNQVKLCVFFCFRTAWRSFSLVQNIPRQQTFL